MQILILSCSLNPQSRSALLAAEAQRLIHERLDGQGQVRLIDLRAFALPMCDGYAAYEDAHVQELSAAITQADAIILAVPIYNYDVNAAAKNVIELTGRAWQDKLVAFLCAAGGKGSYMSVMSVANSLMLDFRCLILPRFIYALGDDFEGQAIDSTIIQQRLEGLCERLVSVAAALATVEASTSKPGQA